MTARSLLAATAILTIGTSAAHAQGNRLQLQFDVQTSRFRSDSSSGAQSNLLSGRIFPRDAQQSKLVLPDTPQGRAATRWLRAVNSGDSATVATYLSDSTLVFPVPSARPLAERVSAMMTTHRSKGELNPVRLGTSENFLSVWLSAAGTGEETLYMFSVESAEPHRLQFVMHLGQFF